MSGSGDFIRQIYPAWAQVRDLPRCRWARAAALIPQQGRETKWSQVLGLTASVVSSRTCGMRDVGLRSTLR